MTRIDRLMLWLGIVFMALCMLRNLTGCVDSSHKPVEIIPIKVETGALRNANIAVVQTEKRLLADPVPSDNARAAILLLKPVPDELKEHQQSYDELWTSAKENESALTQANHIIQLQNDEFAAFKKKVNGWYVGPATERIVGFFILVYLGIGLVYGAIKFGLSWVSVPWILLSMFGWLPMLIGIGAMAHNPRKT